MWILDYLVVRTEAQFLPPNPVGNFCLILRSQLFKIDRAHRPFAPPCMDAETRRDKFATFDGAIQADSRRAGFAFRPGARLEAEIPILAQQIDVLRRRAPAKPLAPRRLATRQSDGRDRPRSDNRDRPRLPDSRSLPHAGTPTFPWSSPPSAPRGLEETRQFPRMLLRSGHRRSRR